MNKKIETEIAEAFGRTFVKGNIPETLHGLQALRQPLQETRTERTRYCGWNCETGTPRRLHRRRCLHDGLPDKGHLSDEQV